MRPEDFRKHFEEKASKFESTPSAMQNKNKSTKSSYFQDAIYGPEEEIEHNSIQSEINRYLGEVCEPRRTDVLAYWKAREATLPGLAKMAKMYLAIPATSVPSKGAFSKTKAFLNPQRSNLSPSSIEILICLKEWFRIFGAMFISDNYISPGDEDTPIELD